MNVVTTKSCLDLTVEYIYIYVIYYVLQLVSSCFFQSPYSRKKTGVDTHDTPPPWHGHVWRTVSCDDSPHRALRGSLIRSVRLGCDAREQIGAAEGGHDLGGAWHIFGQQALWLRRVFFVVVGCYNCCDYPVMWQTKFFKISQVQSQSKTIWSHGTETIWNKVHMEQGDRYI